jgi:hypothetical protein
MVWIARVIASVVVPLIVVMMGCAGRASATGELTLVYSGSLLGELEPCGCTREGDLGGIRRNATAVDRLRAERPGLFLISSGGLFSTQLPTHRITNQYILTGLAELDYDAIGVQWGDLVYGTDFLRGASLPLVASNWQGKEFLPVRRVSRDGQELTYFQWLAPEQSPYRRMLGEHSRVTGEATALATALAEARAGGALTVLAAPLTVAQAKEALPLDEVDVLILPWNSEKFGEPEQLGRTLVLVPGSRGQRLGRVDLTLGPDGRIAGWRHEVITLSESVANAPRLEPWYAGYTGALKQAYGRRVAREKEAAGESPYVGQQVCKACHEQAYATWEATPHAKAFAALQAVDKAFDANCIGCHTVGFGQPGGFIEPEVSGHLLNVGCESCHGPGKAHAASGGTIGISGDHRPGPHTCAGCHHHNHSPSFRYESYWPRIQHGRETQTSAAAKP